MFSENLGFPLKSDFLDFILDFPDVIGPIYLPLVIAKMLNTLNGLSMESIPAIPFSIIFISGEYYMFGGD